MQIKDKNILVTGASGGIGKATAVALADRGAKLFLHYHSHMPTDLERELRQKGANFSFFRADFRQKEQIENMFKLIADNAKDLDAVVNVVGIEYTKEDPLERDMWKDIFEVNLFGTIDCIKHSLKIMRTGSAVVNISSIVGKDGIVFFDNSMAYPASKAALNKITESLAVRYSPKIRFATISPGFTETKIWDGYTPEEKKVFINKVPLKRFNTPEEIAATVIYVLENEAFNGQNILVDGGLGIKEI